MPPDTYVIGGGATVSDDERAYVNDSGPSSQVGWTATGFVRFGSGGTMTVTAVCVAIRKPGSTVSSGAGSSPHPFPIYAPG